MAWLCKASQAMRDAVRKPWEAAVPVARANRRRASESLDDVPQDPRLPSYPPAGPTDRPRDLYGSISRTFGITADLVVQGVKAIAGFCLRFPFVYVLLPLPRCSAWAYSSLISPRHLSLPRKGRRVGLHIVLFEACPAFTRVAARTLALSPIRDTL